MVYHLLLSIEMPTPTSDGHTEAGTVVHFLHCQTSAFVLSLMLPFTLGMNSL